ncbi:hypothetical protein AB0C10_37535 [Microbispora amethystogenes]|uniref:hypothetical protein n=1 Tax=Microbispora amethystogenes TaxID=1427754 RepID=UPI0033FD12DA
MPADLPTFDHLDELVDTDPLRLRDEAFALRARAGQAEAAIARVRDLAEDWKNTPPLDEIDWEYCDPTAGHRSAGRRILAVLDTPTTEETNRP